MAVLKRMLPTAVAIAVGLFVLGGLFSSIRLLDDITSYLIETAVIVAVFALFLGLVNVLRVHARKLRDGHPDRFYSFALIAAMLFVLVLGLPIIPGRPAGPSQPAMQWIFQYIQAPIQATLSALIAIFVAMAACRLLRLRNVESALMLVVALLVLVGQVSVGLLPVMTDMKEWLLDVPVLAGARGILLGVALGAVLTGIRLLLGAERPYSD
jgi:hypothetical protein